MLDINNIETPENKFFNFDFAKEGKEMSRKMVVIPEETVCIPTKEYVALIKENAQYSEILNQITAYVISERTGAAVNYIDCRPLMRLLDIPEIEEED